MSAAVPTLEAEVEEESDCATVATLETLFIDEDEGVCTREPETLGDEVGKLGAVAAALAPEEGVPGGVTEAMSVALGSGERVSDTAPEPEASVDGVGESETTLEADAGTLAVGAVETTADWVPPADTNAVGELVVVSAGDGDAAVLDDALVDADAATVTAADAESCGLEEPDGEESALFVTSAVATLESVA